MIKLSDTYLVAGLMTKGFSPRERILDGGKVYFIFDNSQEIEEHIEDYKNSRMEVVASDYADMVRRLKGLVWETINSKKVLYK
jgi:uncharacterized pyridoxamine 5'-phosphate oxidase family protein